jgi:hypothetical protein
MAMVHKEAIEKAKIEDKPKEIVYPADVKNIHTQTINLESGPISPGEEGKATLAEASCLLGQYVELA